MLAFFAAAGESAETPGDEDRERLRSTGAVSDMASASARGKRENELGRSEGKLVSRY